MTVKLRQRLYYAFFILAIFAFLGGSFLLFKMGFEKVNAFREAAFPEIPVATFLSGIVSVFLCMLVSVVLLGIIAFRTGRNASAEIFFFSLWCASLSFELGRIVILWLVNQGVGLVSLAMVTRFVMFGRYIGSLAIFMGSLFSLGFKQERIPAAFAITIGAALFFASIQPLNTGQLGPGFLVMRGYASLVYAFDLVLVASVCINYLIAFRITRDRAFLLAAAGICGATLSLLLLRVIPGLLLGPLALTALIAGSALYLKTLHSYYLWR